MSDQFEIEWHDRGGPPQVKPNPAFPDGVPEVDIARGKEPNCVVQLPYPTGRTNIGTWYVTCRLCRLRVAITAASRPDDPRSARVPCKIVGAGQ